MQKKDPLNLLRNHKIILLFFCAFVFQIKAQKPRLLHDGPDDKYFVSVAYGTGNASWISKLSRSSLYDTSGSELFTGNVHFDAKNTLSNLTVDVAAQVMQIRLGMGICFEEFYLEKIKINSINYAFSDKFTFSKLFAHAEIPLKKISGELFSFSIKSAGGFYSYYNVNHYNFFGVDAGGTTLFLNSGILADYKLFPHSYLFIQPVIEYKYFKNSKNESPSKIRHNIWSYFVMMGLRIDVSKE